LSTAYSFVTDIDTNGTAITISEGTIAATAIGVNMAVVSVGAGSTVSVTSVLTSIDAAVATVANRRATLGAVSNRFDHIIDNITNVIANTEASKSRVEDADFAVETTNLTRNTVLQQAATSMVAQANASKNSILALIQG
jgi:flagellin